MPHSQAVEPRFAVMIENGPGFLKPRIVGAPAEFSPWLKDAALFDTFQDAAMAATEKPGWPQARIVTVWPAQKAAEPAEGA